MPPIIGGRVIFAIGVGTILYGIAKIVEREINYRNDKEEEIKELKRKCTELRNELDLANHVIRDCG